MTERPKQLIGYMDEDELAENKANKEEGIKASIAGDIDALLKDGETIKFEQVLTPDNEIEERESRKYDYFKNNVWGFENDYGADKVGEIIIPTNDGFTTVAHALVAMPDTDMLKRLCTLEPKMKLDGMVDSKGRTPAFAIFTKANIENGFFDPKSLNNAELRKMLNVLDHYGVEIAQPDKDGKTLLDVAKEKLSPEQAAAFEVEYNKHLPKKTAGVSLEGISPIALQRTQQIALTV